MVPAQGAEASGASPKALRPRQRARPPAFGKHGVCEGVKNVSSTAGITTTLSSDRLPSISLEKPGNIRALESNALAVVKRALTIDTQCRTCVASGASAGDGVGSSVGGACACSGRLSSSGSSAIGAVAVTVADSLTLASVSASVVSGTAGRFLRGLRRASLGTGGLRSRGACTPRIDARSSVAVRIIPALGLERAGTGLPDVSARSRGLPAPAAGEVAFGTSTCSAASPPSVPPWSKVRCQGVR